MKNKVWLIVLAVGALFLIKFLANSLMLKWDRVSENIEFSKKNALFIDSYKIELRQKIGDVPKEDFSKVIEDLEVWSEYEWNVKPFFVFFHPIQKSNVETIIIRSRSKFKYNELYLKNNDNFLLNTKIDGYHYGGAIKNDTNSYQCVLKPVDGKVNEEVDIIFYKNNKTKYFKAVLKRV